MKGKWSLLFALAYSMYSDCFYCVFILIELLCASHVYEIPCKTQRTNHFTSSLRSFEEEKYPSVANLLFSYLHQNWLVRTECLFYAMGTLLFGALLFQIKFKIVLKEYTSNPRMCVAVYFIFFLNLIIQNGFHTFPPA